MNRCPITYEEIPEGEYSLRGLHALSRKLNRLEPLAYSAEELRQEAVRRATKMSIQGVQPKLSARLNVSGQTFDVVDVHGHYILKPPSEVYKEAPQNEDVTMRLAAIAGIEIPFHGMVYARDGSLTYFIKRFDRTGKKGKLAVEDFAQLQGRTRNTKYDSTMEQVAKTIQEFCTFPVVEFAKLFRLTLFNFVVGNEDMHLKNFSLIEREGKVELSPAYDLLNTTIAMGKAVEELALPLHGKKSRLTREDFLKYFGIDRLQLQPKIIDQTVKEFADALPSFFELINISFLSPEMKTQYSKLLAESFRVLGIDPIDQPVASPRTD